jgi:hypothetical protein
MFVIGLYLNQSMPEPTVIPEQTYSTILNCEEGALVCTLRGM